MATLHRVFKDLDAAAFEEVLREWVKDSGADLGLVNGKTLRGIHGEEIPGVHLVSAYAAGSGAALTQAAKAVLGQIPLAGKIVAGKIVVADALLIQREVCQQIVDGGGDCLFAGERESAHVAAGLGGRLFPLWKPEWAKSRQWRPGKHGNGGSGGPR